MNNSPLNTSPYSSSAATGFGTQAPIMQPASGTYVPPQQQEGGIFNDINYKEIIQAIWKNILVIILAALVTGGAFFGYTYFFTKPVYSSSVMVYINQSSVSISGAELLLSSGESYVKTYTTLLSSRTTLEEIAETAGVDCSPEELMAMITTEAVEDAAFLTITVSSDSPKKSELIANTIATVLPTRVSDIVDGSTLRIVDYAIVPSSRSTASLSRNFLIGLAVGAVVVALFIAARTHIRNNHAPLVSSATDLSTFYPAVPVLGVIRDISYSDSRYRQADYGYGKYSDYYSKPNAEANAEANAEKKERTGSSAGPRNRSVKSKEQKTESRQTVRSAARASSAVGSHEGSGSSSRSEKKPSAGGAVAPDAETAYELENNDFT